MEETTRDRLGELLVARGHATEAQVEEAYQRHRDRGVPLGQLLVDMGVLNRLQLAGLLAEQWSSAPLHEKRSGLALPLPDAPPAAEAPFETPPSAAAEPVAPVAPEPALPAAAQGVIAATDLEERLDALDERLVRLEAAVEGVSARLDAQEDAASRQELEDLRLALRELWKVQKSLLERADDDTGGTRAA